MKQRLLLLIFILLGTTVSAQTLSYGLTGRVGAFYTLVSSARANETDFGVGLQAGAGVWAKLPISSQSKIQVSLIQVAERQYAGEVQVIDEDRRPIADAKLRDVNFAAALQVMYLYSLGEKWSIGIGLGSKYEYFSESRIEKDYKDFLIRPNNANKYRRELTLNLPVEIQYNLNERLALVSQFQYQLSNRIEPANADYSEHDLGVSVGINYRLM
ncbi:hypothetical protein [Pontibacter populi]|uniref:Outer membrane protein beta-barrel domain-containing protein n=1 Tax=Pontibacter populi TaxID=890055 RepID=A0ABV1RXI5_9BACT